MNGLIAFTFLVFSFGEAVWGEGQCVSSCGGEGALIGETGSSLYCCRELRGGGYRTHSGTCIPCHDDYTPLLPYSDLDDKWLLTGGSGDDCGVGYGGACSQFASCQMVEEGLRCVCKPGFSGNGLECSDIDECETGRGSCDKRLYIAPASRSGLVLRTRGICSNTPGGFTCSCRKGFTMEGKQCIDENECVSGAGVCAEGAVCRNLVGSYHCSCPEGYEGDGVNCCLRLSLIHQLLEQEQSMAAIEGRQRKRGSGRRRGSRRKKCHHTSRISRRDESSRSSTVRSATTVSQSSGTSVTNAVSLASRSPQSSVRETSVGLSTHSARSPGRDDTSPARQSPRSSVRGSESFPHFTRGCERYVRTRYGGTSAGVVSSNTQPLD